MKNPMNERLVTLNVHQHELPAHMRIADKELTNTALFAENLLARLALISAVEDGVDEAGRQKGRLLTPQEVVTRAFDIAEEFFQQAVAREHYHTRPDISGYVEVSGRKF